MRAKYRWEGIVCGTSSGWRMTFAAAKKLIPVRASACPAVDANKATSGSTMNDQQDAFKKLANALIEDRKSRQIGFVIRGAETLSETLKEAITRKLTRAPPASGRRACPKAFKERIDLARQLGTITEEVHSELEKIRDMRTASHTRLTARTWKRAR